MLTCLCCYVTVVFEVGSAASCLCMLSLLQFFFLPETVTMQCLVEMLDRCFSVLGAAVPAILRYQRSAICQPHMSSILSYKYFIIHFINMAIISGNEPLQ